MIEVRGVHKSYGNTKALDGFSLVAEGGDLVGLVGPNGAGKTTLIKILATLVRADAGEIRVAGLDVGHESSAVRQMTGYLPEVAGIYQEVRVAEFLGFFADAFHLRGTRKKEAVDAALAASGLVPLRARYVEELSLGQKQRLLLAKTTLHSPKVLLLDEPTTGLDPMARLQFRQELRSWQSRDKVILISSHILSDLEEVCTQVVFIANGRNPAKLEPSSDPGKGPQLFCDLEVISDPRAAKQFAESFPGTRAVEARGAQLVVAVDGGKEAAAALLSHLIQSGVKLVRFDPRAQTLEELYRDTFGGSQS